MELDTEVTRELWRRYLESDKADQDAFHKLWEHYTPLAWINAIVMKRRRPDYFTREVEELFSDGVLGLLTAFKYEKFGAQGFRRIAARAIRESINVHERQIRTGHVAKGTTTSLGRQLRAKMIQELGRVPLADELNERLGKLVTNPAFARPHPCEAKSFSNRQLRDLRDAGTSEEKPIDALIQKETMRLGLRGLDPQSKQLMKLALAGHSVPEIAKRTGMTAAAARHRINGAIWEMRCRADLADYLGVESSAGMPRRRASHYPAISTEAPAERAGERRKQRQTA